jgi:hypothetical protein
MKRVVIGFKNGSMVTVYCDSIIIKRNSLTGELATIQFSQILNKYGYPHYMNVNEIVSIMSYPSEPND